MCCSGSSLRHAAGPDHTAALSSRLDACTRMEISRAQNYIQLIQLRALTTTHHAMQVLLPLQLCSPTHERTATMRTFTLDRENFSDSSHYCSCRMLTMAHGSVQASKPTCYWLGSARHTLPHLKQHAYRSTSTRAPI